MWMGSEVGDGLGWIRDANASVKFEGSNFTYLTSMAS